MSNRPPTRPGCRRGFTLIELVVAILIISILGTIAVTSYISQSRKSRRTEAKNAVLDIAGREERNFSTTNQYSQDPIALGYAAVGSGLTFPMNVGSGYYSVNVVVTAAVPGGALATYTVTATAIGDQLKDTSCRTFSITNTGVQAATTSAGAATTSCW